MSERKRPARHLILDGLAETMPYSPLLVSLHAPEVEVDLYTPIANQIAVPVAIDTPT